MPDSTIDEVKRRIDVVELIGETVQLKRSGRGFAGLCPFHGEKTPSFHVSPERGSWRCFGCGEGGDIFSFVQKRDGVGFGEALRMLAERAGVELPDRKRADPTVRERKDRLAEILESTALFYRGLLTGQVGAGAREYLAGRGVTRESIERFGLGYAEPTGRALERHLVKAGFGVDDAVEAGALGRSEDGQRTYDRFRDRVVFPIRDADGRAVGFGGRAMRADQQPKYLNSPQSEMFDKGANLYALDQARGAIRQAGQAIVVEGYMDALIPHQAGFGNVVATLGTALTERHVQVLRRDSAREVILCLDADLAGIRAAVRGSGVAHDGTADEAPRIDFSALNRWERPGRRDGASAAMFLERRTLLKVMTLEGGKDPDEVVRQDPAEWTRAVAAAQPVIDFVLKNAGTIFDLATTDGRREAARAAVALIYDVADPIDRDRQLQRLAGVIGTGVDVLQEFARRSIRLVPPSAAAGPASPVAAPTPSATPAAGASPALTTVARPYEDRLEDLVVALLLRAPEDVPWPEPADFEDAAHRALLERLRAVFPWPDAATALDRLGQDVEDGLAELVERIRVVDEQNQRLALGDLSRELRVRSLELRKLRLFRQHQALDSALREEDNGMNAAERREHHERLARVAADLGGVFAEQRELGVVGSASWSIRRGREVLGG